MDTVSIPRRWPLALAALLAFAWAGRAPALSITGIVVAPAAGNTANALVTGGANRSQIASSAALAGSAPGAVADVVGASVSFDARYAALLAMDRESAGGSATLNATSAYTITFTVDNPTGGTYRLDIDTSRIGALTLGNDGGGTASASLGAVSGLLDGVAAAGLGLAAVAPLSGAASADLPFSQSSPTLSVVASDPLRTFVLAFSWSASATSAQRDAAVRLGLAGALGTTSADDYPGPGGRAAAGDGHRTGVGVTLLSVPEPGTALLLASGLAALALRRRRADR